MIQSSIIPSEIKFAEVFGFSQDQSIQDILMEKLWCSSPTEDCKQRVCRDCKDNNLDLKEELCDIFEQLEISTVSYEVYLITLM